MSEAKKKFVYLKSAPQLLGPYPTWPFDEHPPPDVRAAQAVVSVQFLGF